jgi:Tfp pilus assembly protein PilN
VVGVRIAGDEHMNARAIRIDFAPGARRHARAGRALLLAGVALLAAALWQGGRLVAERGAALSALRELDADRARAAAPPPPKSDPRQLALARTTRQVASTLNTPWADLLGSLGSTARKDVALLGVEPSVAKRSVRLTAEARDDAEMLAYLAALQHDRRLSSVVLASHQVQAQAPGNPVRFQIQAQWGEAP